MIRRTIAAAVLLLALTAPAAAQAEFGFVAKETTAQALRGGIAAAQAGSHPDSFTVGFELNQEGGGHTEGGELRDVVVDLPPGFIGNPEAVKPCSRQQFEGTSPRCPGASQIGVARAVVFSLGEAVNPVYLIENQPGAALQLGFAVFNWAPQQFASLRTDEGYGARVSTPNLPVETSIVSVTVWGTPSDPVHFSERVCAEGTGAAIHGCSAGPAPYEAFLTMPTACGPFETTLRIDSKQDPKANLDEYVAQTVPLRDGAGNPEPIRGCDAVPFEPEKVSATTVPAAESPSGLAFGLAQPNHGLTDPEAITETEAEKMEVSFPAGLAVNPSAAGGLGVCRLGQYQAAACPEDSKVGTLLVKTPLLKTEAIEGSLYVAAPHENPFGSLLALYIIARVPNRGILVKQAGVVRPDPVSGQLTSTFDGLPPLPYSSFEVRLKEGPRAPLITPQLCGDYNTEVRLYPFSDPTKATPVTAPMKISTGAGGGACAASEAQLPNNPALEAGTTAPLAGAYAPFVFKLSRPDGSQRFAGLQVKLPKGVTARLAGVPYCSEPQIAAAAARSREGEGALEAASPSCPAASEVGTVDVGAGAGPSPYHAQGKVYLAGPYKGAPLSLAIITPAIAGPFDLGTVVVRTALYVDETTAEVTAVSDPLPTILAGIPLDVRSVSLALQRPEFALNPTNCEALAIKATLTSTAGQVAPLQNRFKVGGCKNLDFAPKLTMKLSGGTTRAKHPAFKATLTQPAGQANLSRIQLTLPPTEFVDPNHVANPCTRPQFAAGKCPPASVLGKVRAFTPLLDAPLEGPIYFRANGGERELPDAVADLNGQVHLISVGFVDALHKKGSEESRIRTTIASIPDAPISKVVIELKGGKKHGLLVNSANICKSANRAIVKISGQNGKTHNSEPQIATSCKKK